MRWFVEVSSIDGADAADKYCVEAKQWQAALQEARRIRGESGPAVQVLDRADGRRLPGRRSGGADPLRRQQGPGQHGAERKGQPASTDDRGIRQAARARRHALRSAAPPKEAALTGRPRSRHRRTQSASAVAPHLRRHRRRAGCAASQRPRAGSKAPPANAGRRPAPGPPRRARRKNPLVQPSPACSPHPRRRPLRQHPPRSPGRVGERGAAIRPMAVQIVGESRRLRKVVRPHRRSRPAPTPDSPRQNPSDCRAAPHWRRPRPGSPPPKPTPRPGAGNGAAPLTPFPQRSRCRRQRRASLPSGARRTDAGTRNPPPRVQIVVPTDAGPTGCAGGASASGPGQRPCPSRRAPTQPSIESVLAPDFTLVRKREEEPRPGAPITYREYAYAVDPGTDRKPRKFCSGNASANCRRKSRAAQKGNSFSSRCSITCSKSARCERRSPDWPGRIGEEIRSFSLGRRALPHPQAPRRMSPLLSLLHT